jgi:hypothetical protein
MKTDDMPDGVALFGDPKWRGKCPTENVEQASFFSRLRREYPDTYGAIAVHPRNEGLKMGGQLARHSLQKLSAEGMTKGAADIVIPGRQTFVCELKRRDATQSQWQDGQREYLEAAAACGAFVCVGLGAVAAWEAFEVWRAG